MLPSVLIAFAPYWLGFLVVLPYTGPGVARIVKVWHLLLLWQLLRPALGVGSTAALAVAAAAWLAAEAIDVAIELVLRSGCVNGCSAWSAARRD